MRVKERQPDGSVVTRSVPPAPPDTDDEEPELFVKGRTVRGPATLCELYPSGGRTVITVEKEGEGPATPA